MYDAILLALELTAERDENSVPWQRAQCVSKKVLGQPENVSEVQLPLPPPPVPLPVPVPVPVPLPEPPPVPERLQVVPVSGTQFLPMRAPVESPMSAQ